MEIIKAAAIMFVVAMAVSGIILVGEFKEGHARDDR